MGKWLHVVIVGGLIFVGYIIAALIAGFITSAIMMFLPALANVGLIGTIITFLILAVCLGLTIPWLLRRFA